MDLTQAKNILKNHNYWRRGAEIPMLEPKLIGDALDVAIELMETVLKDQEDQDSDILKRC
jgi:hypothetical protein